MKEKQQYTKVRFTASEADEVKRTAQAMGMSMSDYIRDCVFRRLPMSMILDRKIFDAHTQAIMDLRVEIRDVYHRPFPNKILVADEFKRLEEGMQRLEQHEAKIRNDVREVRYILTGKGKGGA